MIRSRAQWIDEGERPTKFFCALETKNFLDKTIKKIYNDKNQIVTDQMQILKSLHNYYERLFGNRDVELEHKNIEDLLQTDQIPKLTDLQKTVLKAN